MTNTTSKFFKAGITAAVVVASGVAVAPIATEAQEVGQSFKDVSNKNQFKNDINKLVERGVVTGFPEDGTFRPNNEVTRGQAAKIIAGILNLDTENVANPGFTDISKDHQYYGAIAALENAGIIQGYSEDNTFRSGEPITRNHMAKMIAIGFDLQAQGEAAPFTDMRADYKDFITALHDFNVTTGKTATTYDGSSNVTRGQMAAFVMRAFEADREVTFKLNKIEGANIKTNKGIYANELPIFASENAKALENAQITAIVENGQLKSIKSLTLNASGTEEAPMVFDGENMTIDGNVSVNGDFITLKNLTVEKDVTLTGKVTNEFNSNGLNINGELIIDAEVQSPVASLMRTFAIASVNGPKINLTDSTVNGVTANRNHVSFTSNKKVTEVKVAQNVSSIEMNADVELITVNRPEALQISGSGAINKVTLNQATQLSLQVAVKELDVKNQTAQVTLGDKVSVAKIIVPKGSDISKVVSNYESVKENIADVKDETGTVATVSDLKGFKIALANEDIKTIRLASNIENVAERIVIDRAVTVDGGGHKISFTDAINELTYGTRQGILVAANDVVMNDLAVSLTSADKWQGAYAVQVYNAQNVTLHNFDGSSADAALLVNGADVNLTGVTKVAGNEFGGIEVSQGTGLENAGKLTVTGTLENTTEQYAQPSIWVVNGQGSVEGNVPTVTNTTIKADQTQYYVSEQLATTVNVNNVEDFNKALANNEVQTIALSDSFTTTERIIVNRPVTIDGKNHTISFEGDVKGETQPIWNSNYVMQVYNTNDVTIRDIKLTNGDGALLINSSEVKFAGTIDVSGNEFGGIESSVGQGLTVMPKLDVTEANFVNNSEKYGLPTLWEDKITGSIVGAEEKLTSSTEVKADQVQYYVASNNVIDPMTIANVENLDQLKAALADEKVTTINVTADIENVSERLVVNRATTINGGEHKISFTDAINGFTYGSRHGIAVLADDVVINDLEVSLTDAAEWQGTYAIQVYNAQDVTLNNFTGNGADAALLVNAAKVELTGTTNVSGNEFGGIEVSKGSLAGLADSLLTIEGTIANNTESQEAPTIWVVRNNDEAKSPQGQLQGSFTLTLNAVEKEEKNQTYYFITVIQ